MNFEAELKKGHFMVPECLKCKDVIWPPSDYCSHCFGKISWRELDGIGTILEFSKNRDVFFCLVEFEKNIRILGALDTRSKPPEINKKVKIENCKMDGKNYNFTLMLI